MILKDKRLKIKDLELRIKKIKGQVNGIEKMIREKRGCLEVVQQISAARSALAKVASLILTQESCRCEKNKKPQEFAKIVEELVKNL